MGLVGLAWYKTREAANRLIDFNKGEHLSMPIAFGGLCALASFEYQSFMNYSTTNGFDSDPIITAGLVGLMFGALVDGLANVYASRRKSKEVILLIRSDAA
jgi:hypothetical protein